MSCIHCLRTATRAVAQPLRQITTPFAQRRTFGVLSSLPSRPSVLPTRPTLAATSIEQTTFTQLTSLTGVSISQVRGAKRATYNPSHVVRKRRHGYLSRIKTRTGRQVLKRRQLKKRNTLSH